VHANGFNNQDVLSGGGPVGTMYGTAYFNTDASSGNGYNMVDGTFRNGGNSQDLQMGLAGTPDEGTFSVATAFFPFLEGWAGGYVSNALPGPGGATLFDNGLATPGMTPAVANWLGDFSVGRANVNLTSFRSDFTPAHGMLFVAPNSGNNNANIAASISNGNGWDIAIREDNDLDTTGNTFAARTDSQFSFMYMDFRYAGLIGARIAGATGNTIQGAGAYTLTRLGTGTYALTIAGKVDTSGMLLLSGAGAQAGAPTLPSRAFFSYQYDAANSRFVIQARQLTTGGNPFGEDSPLVDADFNFAYVDFTNPVRPVIAPTVTGISVNGGAQQRSRVTTVDVSFSTIVTFAGPVANAFTFTHNGGGAVGGFSATANVVGGVTVVTLNNFTGAETEFGSLVDGRFTLTVLANQVSSGGVNMASNATFTDTNGLFRLFGDVNGDRTVNGLDLGFFRNAFGTSAGDPNYLSYLDFNGDGVINGFDLGQLRTRFGTVPP
jgi:hypothetical protein